MCYWYSTHPMCIECRIIDQKSVLHPQVTCKLTYFQIICEGKGLSKQYMTIWEQQSIVSVLLHCRVTGLDKRFTHCCCCCYWPYDPCRLVYPLWWLGWQCPLLGRWQQVLQATCPPAIVPCGFETMASSPKMYILRDWDTQKTQQVRSVRSSSNAVSSGFWSH